MNTDANEQQDRESVGVLNECIELQRKKSRDYQNDVSSVRQADYYRLGIDSIYDMLHTKMLRVLSLTETVKNNPDASANFESIEDTLKDLINYASFGVAWLRGKVDGQVPDRDMFNRPTAPKFMKTGMKRLQAGQKFLVEGDPV